MGGPKLKGSRTRKARAVLRSSIVPSPPSPAAARRTGWWWCREEAALVITRSARRWGWLAGWESALNVRSLVVAVGRRRLRGYARHVVLRSIEASLWCGACRWVGLVESRDMR